MNNWNAQTKMSRLYSMHALPGEWGPRLRDSEEPFWAWDWDPNLGKLTCRLGFLLSSNIITEGTIRQSRKSSINRDTKKEIKGSTTLLPRTWNFSSIYRIGWAASKCEALIWRTIISGWIGGLQCGWHTVWLLWRVRVRNASLRSFSCASRYAYRIWHNSAKTSKYTKINIITSGTTWQSPR